jgi:hypothetical protein
MVVLSRFRDPGAREAAWGRYYRRKGTAVVVMRDTRAPAPEDRRAAWAAKYARLPEADRIPGRPFNFAPEREPVDCDAYLIRSA